MATAQGSSRPMRGGFDRSLLFVLGGALALIVIGLISTAVLERTSPSFAPASTPEGTVQRFYASLYAGDYAAAYGMLSPGTQRTIAERDLRERMSYDLRQSQARVGLASVQGDRATVPVTITHYSQDGLFGAQEWTSEQEISLVQTNGVWLLLGGPF
ncbi:hypothetical protein SE17_24360 [Kouleothrix aurantiaca]|uniref:DUF4878 domain-containing protein n=1 Tax=Kouleothrix aurantiaca TaxID=186479 RepID=A0A0P9F2X0_9CHLR|nr:hypothetical protein SE17_24360 [Kouleothrix aurantiaca]